MTFTNKAAGEMRERIARLLGRATGGHVGRNLPRHRRADAPRGAAPRRSHAAFTIYDQDDTQSRHQAHDGAQHSSNVKQFTPRGVHGAISDAKNALVTPDEYANLAMDPFSRAVAVVYRELGEALRVANAVDFDDLLVLPVRLLAENPQELEKYRRKFQYLLVDEYQDTNRAQYQFIKLLAGGHGNVCVVGDDDQSIYGWRGADIRNILDFNKDFPERARRPPRGELPQHAEVLDLANVVISAEQGPHGEDAAPHARQRRARHGRRAVSTSATRRTSSSRSSSRVARSRRRSRCATSRSSIARTRRAARSRKRCASARCRIASSARCASTTGARSAISCAYLKLVANPADDEAFRRAVAVPKRGLGETTIEQLSAVARERGRADARRARSARISSLRCVPPRAPRSREFAALIARFRERAREAAVDELLREIVDAIRYGEYLRAEGPGVGRIGSTTCAS